MEPIPLEIDAELRVVTENSIWLVRADSYCRMPRVEAPRRPSTAALADGTWHDHVGAWLVFDGPGLCIRLLPADRPPGSAGILTGAIITCEPAWRGQPSSARSATRRTSIGAGGPSSSGVWPPCPAQSRWHEPTSSALEVPSDGPPDRYL